MTHARDTENTTVNLAFPITVDGTEYSSLSFRRIKVRDQLAASKSSASDEEKEIHLIANLSEVGFDVITALDIADYVKIQEVLQDFSSSPRQPPGS